VSGRPGFEFGFGDSFGDDVGQQEGLEGMEIAGFEEETLEIGVEIAFEGFVSGSEDCDVVAVVHDSVLQSLQKHGFFHKLSEFGVMGVQQSDKD